MSDDDLTTNLKRIVPDGLSYSEAVKTHVRLFSSLDGIPLELHRACDRDGLSQAFAALASSGWVRAVPKDVDGSSPAHWSGLLDDMLLGRLKPEYDLPWLPDASA